MICYHCNVRRNARNRLIGIAAIAAALVAFGVGERGCHAAEVRSPLALAKCRLIVKTLYPDSGFWPWCGTLIAEHERYAEKKGAPEFAGAWWYSLVYGGANIGLRVGAVAPGNCAGPMDVKATSLEMHRRMTRDATANIHYHVAEFWLGYTRGYRDRGLCEYTMYPARPFDWGHGMFAMTEAKHRRVICAAYREGRLP